MIEVDITGLLRSRQLWPIPGACFVMAVIYWLYAQPALRDTVYDYRIWVSWGAVLLLAGILLLLLSRRKSSSVKPSRKERRAAQARRQPRAWGWAVTALGGAMCAGGLWLRTIPSLPDDAVVVTVLQFTAVSDAYATEADNYTDRIYTVLRQYTRSGPIVVKRLPESVGLVGDEAARRDSAIALGRTRTGAAHFVLWGDLVLDADTLTIRPRLTIVRQPKQVPVPDVEFAPLTSWDPDHLIFKQWSSDKLATLTPLIIGWSYLKAGDPIRAIWILSPLSTDESHLLSARAYRNRFATADDPKKEPGFGALFSAVRHYESVMGPHPWESGAKDVPETLIAAAYERADVLHQLTTFDDSGSELERASFLKEAISALEALSAIMERADRGSERTSVLLKLAACLGFYSEFNVAAADSLLDQSWSRLAEAERTYTGHSRPSFWIEVEGFRASILRARGMRDRGPKGNAYLQDVLRRAQIANATAMAADNPSQLLWYNIATASEELANRSAGEVRRHHATTAIEYYDRIAADTRDRGGTVFEVERDQSRADSARIRLLSFIK